jgi:hypothetical protein
MQTTMSLLAALLDEDLLVSALPTPRKEVWLAMPDRP